MKLCDILPSSVPLALKWFLLFVRQNKIEQNRQIYAEYFSE